MLAPVILLLLPLLLVLWANSRLRARTFAPLDVVVVGFGTVFSPSDVPGDCKLLLPDKLEDWT